MNNSSIAKNASLYDNSEYIKEHTEPDTFAYSSKFYAKNHIPSAQERPGNNTINVELYKKYKPEYNLFCYR
jgi:hypothetical protein